jgi:ABC-type dipeptide/oligopeptide/nickel transport system ATPase component
MLAFDPVFSIGDQIAESVMRHRGVGKAARAGATRSRADPKREARLDAYGAKTACDFKYLESGIVPKLASLLDYSQVTSNSTRQM